MASKTYAFASTRTLSTMATRAIVYESNGHPASALSVVTYPPLPKPTGSSVTVKHLLSPIHPSDINVVEGVYPNPPRARQLTVRGEERTLHILGNEGLGEITDVGEAVNDLKKGDWVLFAKGQPGTWSSGQTVEEVDVMKVDRETGISAVNAATLAVRSIWKTPVLGTRRSSDNAGESNVSIQYVIRICGPATWRLGCAERC